MLYHSSNLRKVFASKFTKGLLIPDPESQITQYPLLVQLKSGADKKLRVQLLQSCSEGMDADTMRNAFVQVIASSILKDRWINPAALLTSYTTDKPTDFQNTTSNGNVNHTTDSDLIGDRVHMADLINAIRYSLFQESLLHQRLNASEMSAIHAYLVVLGKYFPFEHENQKRWVKRMSVWVKARNETTAASLHAAMKAGAEGLVFPNRAYVSCRGSRPDLRGYPCGLWLLFHTLTVQEHNAMLKNSSLPHMVLFAMRDYVRFFFTCKHCSQDFNSAAHDLDKRLSDVTSSVMWLWQAHNEVNKRLAKTETEDPAHPKIVYPSHELCDSCRSAGTEEFNSSEVLAFLRRKYERRYLVRRLPSHSCRTTQQITSLFLSCLLLISCNSFLFTD
jgi:thiol oxidase